MAKTRLDELYRQKIRHDLQKELKLKNIMEVPKLEKVVLNIGVKEAVADSRILQKIGDMLTAISGQAVVKTIAKKSIAGFKIREGMPLGVMVTLRSDRMYEFLDRLINIALPNVRDFRGVTTKFDRQGNYNLGIKEWNIFPETDRATIDKPYGMNVTIHIKNSDAVKSHALLKSFSMPFRLTEKA